MGVHTTTYLIHGIVLNQEQEAYVNEHYFDKDHSMLQYIEGWPEAKEHILLMDNMSGDYMVFGKVLCARDEYGGDGSIENITIPDKIDKEIVMAHYYRCFPEEIKIDFNQINLMMVAHYS